VVDVATVPDRLKNSVAEAKHHEVLDSFFSEVVIDAVNLALVQHRLYVAI
jgi:hypothetical protein